MGRYDNPAFINYILDVTKREKLIYIGHSQGEVLFLKEKKSKIIPEKCPLKMRLFIGTRTLFICLHYHPEYNDKIELMVAMAPVTTLAHTKALFNVLAPLQLPFRVINASQRVFHYYTSINFYIVYTVGCMALLGKTTFNVSRRHVLSTFKTILPRESFSCFSVSLHPLFDRGS